MRNSCQRGSLIWMATLKDFTHTLLSQVWLSRVTMSWTIVNICTTQLASSLSRVKELWFSNEHIMSYGNYPNILFLIQIEANIF